MGKNVDITHGKLPFCSGVIFVFKYTRHSDRGHDCSLGKLKVNQFLSQVVGM